MQKIISYNRKPQENNPKSQLFSFDIVPKSGAKNFFFDTYENLFNTIKKNDESCFYEDNTFTTKIKLFIDIDGDFIFPSKLERDKCANDILGNIIVKINAQLYRVYKINDPKIIVLISNTLDKLSLHLIYPDIIFNNITEIKFFMMDLKTEDYIDHSVYKIGCFRTLYSSKLGYNNKLILFRCINCNYNNDYELFLNSCICYVNNIEPIKINQKEYIIDSSKKINLPIRNYIYKNINFNKIKESLNKLNNYSDNYLQWLLITFCLKDLYLSSNKNEQLNVYKLFEEFSKQSIKYNKKNNKNIFFNVEPKLDINYLFKISDNDYHIFPFYDYKNIIFNKNNHTNIIVKNEKYIDLDINEILTNKYIFIKSPTGTGKTTYLKKLINKININNIISITSRVNLAGEHVKHLNLEFYLDLKNFEKSNKLVIQLESLIKCEYELYKDGIVILDEINSLLSHLRSPTLDKRRKQVYMYLIELITNARYVICLDADLSDWNINFLQEIKKEQYIVYYNTIQNKLNNKAVFYVSDQIMIDKMDYQIKNKEYFISCFDSLKKMNLIIEYLLKTNKKDDFLIYSSEINYSLIDTSLWENKFVFFTPTIIYGIDFNYLPVDVFCFVYKTHLNPLQIYQMISRARNQKLVHVYCKEKEYICKYKSVDDVINETKLYEKNFGYLLPTYNNYIDIDDKAYRIMYYNYKFMDSILKTNIKAYLIDIMENKGYDIEYNNENKNNILDKKEISIIKIKERIVHLLKLNKENLTDFENELVSNDKSLEKHFNLRIFLNSDMDDKLGQSIKEKLFVETLKNKYSKIKICKDLMKILGINSLDDLNKDIIKKFNNQINNVWLKENLGVIKKTFDIRTKKYDDLQYYNVYLLTITILKNLFDVNLFIKKDIIKNKNRYICYILNDKILLNHNQIINILQIDFI
jgi:hypothetical protein